MMTGTETALIKGSAMVASGGVMAELIIFNDPMYITLAVSGAFVSFFGVVHEITKHKDDHTFFTATGEMIRGLTLGFIAIPFWYLLLCNIGDQTIANALEIDNSLKMEKSIWLIVAFVLSWFTIPIMDKIILSSRWVSEWMTARFKNGDKNAKKGGENASK